MTNVPSKAHACCTVTTPTEACPSGPDHGQVVTSPLDISWHTWPTWRRKGPKPLPMCSVSKTATSSSTLNQVTRLVTAADLQNDTALLPGVPPPHSPPPPTAGSLNSSLPKGLGDSERNGSLPSGNSPHFHPLSSFASPPPHFLHVANVGCSCCVSHGLSTATPPHLPTPRAPRTGA